MFPLTRQVQVATGHSAACVARLAGIDAADLADTDTTFEG